MSQWEKIGVGAISSIGIKGISIAARKVDVMVFVDCVLVLYHHRALWMTARDLSGTPYCVLLSFSLCQ